MSNQQPEMTMTLDEIRRLDECLATCVEPPRIAVAKIDANKLRQWLEYAEGQIWKPLRLRRFIKVAKKQLVDGIKDKKEPSNNE